ncbi:hypothetical protein B0H12DRAFT_327177 [Mycena haematopus]|nr:hypothetical protein B0H12DRAFT_327177 [Mycena haematopus]
MIGERDAGDVEILDDLSLPALEVLSFPIDSPDLESVSGFLKRSSPPLQDLAMGWRWSSFETQFVHLDECLRLIPSLARFKMWGPDSQLVADLFTALDDFPSLLLNLASLTINMVHYSFSATTSSVISNSAWWTLLRVVSTRRMQLHIVPVELPPADIIDAFRQLVVEGVDIHIGTEELNSLDS